mgnify:CR=1 FL=1
MPLKGLILCLESPLQSPMHRTRLQSLLATVQRYQVPAARHIYEEGWKCATCCHLQGRYHLQGLHLRRHPGSLHSRAL